MKTYAVKAIRTGVPLLGTEAKTIEEWKVVEANCPDAAVEFLSSRSSIGAIRDGVTFEVYDIGDLLEVWHSTYDGPPMERGTRRVTVRRVDLEEAVR